MGCVWNSAMGAAAGSWHLGVGRFCAAGPVPCCKPLQAGEHQGQGEQLGQPGQKHSWLSAPTASMETPSVGLFSVGLLSQTPEHCRVTLISATDPWASSSQTL